MVEDSLSPLGVRGGPRDMSGTRNIRVPAVVPGEMTTWVGDVHGLPSVDAQLQLPARAFGCQVIVAQPELPAAPDEAASAPTAMADSVCRSLLAGEISLIHSVF